MSEQPRALGRPYDDSLDQVFPQLTDPSARSPRVLDLFAGAGGWDIAAHELGWHVDGVEIMPEAQQTRLAAGLGLLETGPRGESGEIRSDVRDVSPAEGDYDGVIASPPCQSFSMAGSGVGRKALDAVLAVVASYLRSTPMTYAEAEALTGDARTALVVEPLRIVLGCLPTFTAWEQVPAVLPVWEACAEVLRGRGYSVVTGILNAEQYGVPQTRKRAVLIARRDGVEAVMPRPTHSRFHSRAPERLDDGVLPWVSMAQALGWGMTERPSMTVTGGGADTGGAEPFGNAARASMLREFQAGHWALRNGHQPRAAVRNDNQPSPTIHFGNDSAQVRWVQRSNYSAGRNGGTTAAERGRTERTLNHPSVTVTGKPPSWADPDSDRASTAGGMRITVAEAAILQTFPPDHPFQGSKGRQYLQVGNAVPPLLARAILSMFNTAAQGGAPMTEPSALSLTERMAAAEAESAGGAAPEPAPAPLPRIDITGEAEGSRALRRALRRGILPDVYVRHGELVEISEATAARSRRVQRRGRQLAVRGIEPSSLRRLLSEHAWVFRMKPDKVAKGDAPSWSEHETSPAVQMCRDVLSATDWAGVPPLFGVSTSPVLRPDGSLVQTPGYDKATGVYYSPTLDVGAIPDRPGEVEVAAAREFILDDVLGNFPWIDKSDRANYLGLLVTPLLRWYTGALSPLGAISAAAAGTGKTLLAGDIPQALYGLTSRPWVGNDEEIRKSISTILTNSTAPVVLFDNVPEWESVKSAQLAKLLTSEQWDDRMLGGNQGIEAENDRLWLATGNAMSFGGDMPSRTVLVRLDAKVARPDLRAQDEFKIPDMQDWLKDPSHAAEVLRALLILIVDWVAAGARPGLYTKRQFTRWARAAGGFLAHHGVHGFLMNEDALEQADDELTMWLGFAHEWYTHFGNAWKSATEVHASATNFGFDSAGAIADPWHGHYLTDGHGRPVTAVGLGKRLGSKLDRIFGSDAEGYRIERLTDSRTGQGRYRVVRAAEVTGAAAPADARPSTPAPRQPGLFDTDSDEI